MWKKLRQSLTLDDPTEFHDSIYLGCGQTNVIPPNELVQAKSQLYQKLFQFSSKVSSADAIRQGMKNENLSVFTRDSSKSPRSSNGSPKGEASPRSTSKGSLNREASKSVVHPIQGWQYSMQGHAAQCVERYLELANKSSSCLRQVSTPCVDEHSIASENFDVKGELAHCCSRIVLKALFSARRSRPDTLWSVNTLARNVTKWTKADDQRLHRLISYLHSTQNFTQIAFVGDDFDDCHLALFADASFAGDLQDSKSTSGCFLALVGPRTFVPISWFTKKQTVISHSSSMGS